MAEKGAIMDQAMKAYLGNVPQISYNFKNPKEAGVSLKRKAIRILLNIRIHTPNRRTTLATSQIGILHLNYRIHHIRSSDHAHTHRSLCYCTMRTQPYNLYII